LCLHGFFLYPGGAELCSRMERRLMDRLFTNCTIGSLALPNRLVRSATAEHMADEAGRPREQLGRLYADLVRGGVGLIITGHMYVHPAGKCHNEMTGIYTDELIPDLRTLADGVHALGGLVIAQINHGGMDASADSVHDPMAPSSFEAEWLKRPARAMTDAEIDEVIEAYAAAARRAQRAGLDGVQIHAAHGYLVSQFLSPVVNRRTDRWGGNIEGRMLLLRRICSRVRDLVGPDYPVITKLGLADRIEGGLALAEGLQVVAALEEMGLDAVEISAGIGGKKSASIWPGIRREADEAYFRDWSRQARQRTRLTILLVGGMRSRAVMEDVLASGDADLISMSRPLICEPDLPQRLRTGQQTRSSCISGGRCWAEAEGVGISCKCPLEHRTT